MNSKHPHTPEHAALVSTLKLIWTAIKHHRLMSNDHLNSGSDNNYYFTEGVISGYTNAMAAIAKGWVNRNRGNTD